jgi:hypothetical protein
MSKEHVEALGYTFVENNELPFIVRDWCVGDSILCTLEPEFPPHVEDWNAVRKKLKPFPIEEVLKGYRIRAGMIVLDRDS